MSGTAVRRHSTGGVVALVLGSLLGLVALAVLAGGGTVLWADRTQRDADGYFTTSTHRYEAAGFAITHEGAKLTGIPGWIDTGKLARIRIDATAALDGKALFVGIAPQGAVDAYLAGVAHARLHGVDVDPFTPNFEQVTGTAQPAAPTAQRFWTASATGLHPVLTWGVREGKWAAVVMNADGSAHIAADMRLGANIGYLGWIWGGLFGAGALLLTLSGLLIALGARGNRWQGDGGLPAEDGVAFPAMAPTALAASAPRPVGVYPAALTARLDEPLGRALWLVKWLLLIPHVIVLALLWVAFAVLTVVAGFAILVTGRYPRGIFDFDLGVLRWTWRVHYYGYGALATDSYPPFSLGEEPGYPARLEVVYPERLSRGLVLVKWLLALPHVLIVCLTAGGFWFWHSSWPGLIGLLALFAGVAVLFGRGYPRGLFDLLMGFNRWALRTVAYVALMTDEYPPFRLDMGGDEPQDVPPAGAMATA